MSFSNFVGAITLVIAIYILWQIRSIILLAFAAILFHSVPIRKLLELKLALMLDTQNSF